MAMLCKQALSWRRTSALAARRAELIAQSKFALIAGIEALCNTTARLRGLHVCEHPQLLAQPASSTRPHRAALEQLCSNGILYPPGLQGPFAQTLMAATSRSYQRRAAQDVTFCVQRLEAMDGAQHSLAWLDVGHLEEGQQWPILFCAHGFGGDQLSHYVTELALLCIRNKWRLVVHVRRGHGDNVWPPPTKHFQESSYASLDDTAQALKAVRATFPEAPILGVGVSAGGNVIAAYQGHAGDTSELCAAVTVSSSGCDISLGTQHLAPLSNDLLVSCALNTFARHLDITPIPSSLRSLDNILHGDVDKYYLENSACTVFANIAHPLLCIHALEDPVMPALVMQRIITAAFTNENIMVLQTQHGGHVGWIRQDQSAWWCVAVECFAHSVFGNRHRH